MAHTLEGWSLRYGDFPNLTIAAPDYDICEMIYHGREETDEYAYLIAISPDLLAFCRDLYAEVGKGGDLDWHLREQGYAERLRVLIEKAEAD